MPVRFPRRRLLCLAAGLALGLSAFQPAGARAEGITVFAAASLKTAMDEIAARFTDVTGHDVTVSHAGSSALARQIQQGAPADVFISANPDWMDVLEADGLIDAETRFDLLGNRIVLIAHDAVMSPVEISPGMDLAGMLGDGRLTMALVDAVPAGIYGKAALQTLGIWQAVEAQVAQTDNVRAALALVSLGEAPLGIVYATDAMADDGVSVIGTFPADSHPEIIYPAAVIAASDTPVATRFLDHLRGPDARAVFERQGFTVIAE